MTTKRCSVQRIHVRRAYTGETMTTLDEIDIPLGSDHLVIADDRDARALGGVIGGLDSGITEATTDVVLESASFDPSNNRRTAQDFSLRTEATLRFEKGLRPYLPPWPCDGPPSLYSRWRAARRPRASSTSIRSERSRGPCF